MTQLTKVPSATETKDVNEDIRQACEVLEKGGIILYPTDTVWGIGCDATNPEAVRKVYKLKKRDDSKALITLVASSSWIDRYVEDVPEVAREILDATIKPLTIIYDRGKNLAENLLASDGSIGIRITGDFYSSELCRRFNRPIVSTSANISGEKAPSIFSEIAPEIIGNVDFVASWRRDDKEVANPSGIIKIGKGGVINILR